MIQLPFFRAKVHNETFLSDGTVSISFAGVELARKIFSDLRDKNVLLIGAGKTAELAAFHFQENGVKNIHVVNRTLARAEELADKYGPRFAPPTILREMAASGEAF